MEDEDEDEDQENEKEDENVFFCCAFGVSLSTDFFLGKAVVGFFLVHSHSLRAQTKNSSQKQTET